jgi:phage major head subunit gpT-like protein
VFQRILKVRNMGNKPFVKTTTVASFGSVPIKSENSAVTYDDLAAGYDVTYQADTYELAFRASKEALDDEQEEVVSDAARALGSSMNYTYDVDHANLFNNGFSSTAGSPDGVALFSTAHPLVGGGTNQNRPTTDGDLSVAQLRTAINDIANTKDDAGKIVHWRPKVLFISFNQKWLAMELLGSELRADTADNAVNAFKDDGLVAVATPYLTDQNAFFLLSEPSKHNVRTYWREKPNVLHDWDFETSSMKVKIRSRWRKGWSDWRGVYGTSGNS